MILDIGDFDTKAASITLMNSFNRTVSENESTPGLIGSWMTTCMQSAVEAMKDGIRREAGSAVNSTRLYNLVRGRQRDDTDIHESSLCCERTSTATLW